MTAESAFTALYEALRYARLAGGTAALGLQSQTLTGLAGLHRVSGGYLRIAAGQLAEAAAIRADEPFRGTLASTSSNSVAIVLSGAAHLAGAAGDEPTALRFRQQTLRAPNNIVGNTVELVKLAGSLLGVDAAPAAAMALRLAQEHSPKWELAALARLTLCADALHSPTVLPFAILAAHRGEFRGVDGSALLARFGTPDLDWSTRQAVEDRYRSDRGASLLQEAFGLSVDDLDAANERLGQGTDEELRGYLLEVQRYCETLAAEDRPEPE